MLVHAPSGFVLRSRAVTRRISLPLALLLVAPAVGCATATIPDPKDAVSAYAEAAQKGDADAIY